MVSSNWVRSHLHPRQCFQGTEGCLGDTVPSGKENHSWKTTYTWNFPGSPVVKISPSYVGSVGSVPAWGFKMPHASQPKNQSIKQK